MLIDADFNNAASARRTERSSNGIEQIHECDIRLGSNLAQFPEDLEPEEKADYREREREVAVHTLVHELGHCVGLVHSEVMSLHGRWDRGPARKREWRGPCVPAMSYGYSPAEQMESLCRDDIVGASLLRPAAGWQESTGSVSGILRLAGEPLPYAQVWALPAGAQALEDRIGAFSNASGGVSPRGTCTGTLRAVGSADP